MDNGHSYMLDAFKEDKYTKKQVQQMAWRLRKAGFPASAKFLAEVAQLMEEDDQTN